MTNRAQGYKTVERKAVIIVHTIGNFKKHQKASFHQILGQYFQKKPKNEKEGRKKKIVPQLKISHR